MIKMNYTYYFSLKLLFFICSPAPIHRVLEVKHEVLEVEQPCDEL